MHHGMANLLSKEIERRIVAFALLMAVILASLGAVSLVRSSLVVHRLEADHKVFAWPFENTRIRSTMDPSWFAEAAGLMQRWSPRRGVYVISQYDTLLTWLGDKYSLMPHADLVSYLNSPAALGKTVNLLKERRPEILFVDSCIDCSLATLQSGRPALLGINPEQYAHVHEKIDRLTHLREAFDKIGSDYELVERGTLISVYRLKGKH
jgi:hypothetical protein